MTDLIRREDAIKSLRGRFCGDCKPCAKCDVCDTDTLFNDLMRIPAADAVEVVKCGDCEYYKPYDIYDGKIGSCRKNGRMFMVRNEYCGKGVRKEDAEKDA